jgi:AAA family ATP:ADP antiporter
MRWFTPLLTPPPLLLLPSLPQVFARASKYSLFDPAKEMVYIEMDADEKKQGKAAVDLVGSQIGKSGASWITQAFLLGCGSIAAAMPFTGVIFAGVILTWIKVRGCGC